MKKFEVEIKATIRKTIIVEAESAEDAVAEAHDRFSVLCDGHDEYYEQDTERVRDVTDAKPQ